MHGRGEPPHDPLGAFCRDNHVALAHTGDGVLDDGERGAAETVGAVIQ